MAIKGKTEELLEKQLKICEKKMQELIDSIKRPNLRIMGIEEEEEGQENIVNKIITENFPNLEKTSPFRYRKPPEHQTNMIKIELPHDISSIKQQIQRLEKEH
jgi:hypothetical protein